jgi:hypothetical protein
MIVDESNSTLNTSNLSSDSTSDHQSSSFIEQTVQQSNSEFSQMLELYVMLILDIITIIRMILKLFDRLSKKS